MPKIGAAGGRKSGESHGFSTSKEYIRRRAVEQALTAAFNQHLVESVTTRDEQSKQARVLPERGGQNMIVPSRMIGYEPAEQPIIEKGE